MLLKLLLYMLCFVLCFPPQCSPSLVVLLSACLHSLPCTLPCSIAPVPMPVCHCVGSWFGSLTYLSTIERMLPEPATRALGGLLLRRPQPASGSNEGLSRRRSGVPGYLITALLPRAAHGRQRWRRRATCLNTSHNILIFDTHIEHPHVVVNPLHYLSNSEFHRFGDRGLALAMHASHANHPPPLYSPARIISFLTCILVALASGTNYVGCICTNPG